MTTFEQLQEIARYATLENRDMVKDCLHRGVTYREALLYIEAFHRASNAKQVLQDCAFCDCGQLAIRFPVQKCGNCSFQESMKQIEYKSKSRQMGYLEDGVMWYAIEWGVGWYLGLSIHARINFKQSYFN